jgi:Fe2+ transport system protein FeoA
MEVPLSRLKRGERGIIKYLQGGFGIQRKMTSLGLIVGKKIKVLSAQPFRGPIVISIDNIKIAIGRGMANRIIVEKSTTAE